jgi:hypothetical protein
VSWSQSRSQGSGPAGPLPHSQWVTECTVLTPACAPGCSTSYCSHQTASRGTLGIQALAQHGGEALTACGLTACGLSSHRLPRAHDGLSQAEFLSVPKHACVH